MSDAPIEDIESHPKYLAALGTIEELSKDNRALRDLLYLAKYASKSERRLAREVAGSNQRSLFEVASLPEAAPQVQELEPEIEVPSHKRRVRKRHTDKDGNQSHFPASLERRDTVLAPECPLNCEHCGKDKQQVSKVVSEKLQVEPAQFYVERVVKPVLGCGCKQGAPVKAESPDAVLPKSVLGTSFIANSLTQKFAWHLPFYRQSQMLAQQGLEISRDVLINTALKVANELGPVVRHMAKQICLSELVHMDETPCMVAVKDESGKASFNRNSYFWPILANKMVVFHYTGNRRHANVQEILGSDFKGVLVSDGYEAYKSYAATHHEVTLALCWDHARRKFFEIAEFEPLAKEAVGKIGHFYKVESDIKELEISRDKVSDYRKKHALPQLNQLFEWCNKCRMMPSILPKSKLMEAFSYVVNHWGGLTTYLENGIIPISNIIVEQQIRSLKLGAKNWLFAASELGAEAVAIFNSLVCTCKMNNINIFDYFVYALSHLGSETAANLTPLAWHAKSSLKTPAS